MNDTDPVHFLPSEEIFNKAQVIFDQKKKELESLLPMVDIQHVGSCAIPGAIGKFDIDIQIRVEKQQFREVVDAMKLHYIPKHPDWLWNANLAVLKMKKGYRLITLLQSKM